MNVITLRSLSARHFMSLGTVKVNLDNQGLVLVLGENKDSNAMDSNGSGKTLVTREALYWVLFGKTLRDIPADAIPNRNGDGTATVWLRLCVNSVDYVVRRHRGNRFPALT